MTEKIELKGTIKQKSVKGSSLGYAGPQGPRGEKGENGFSPIITTTETENGYVINITDSTGSESIELTNGETGPAGRDGTNGTNGADGVSPTINATPTASGYDIEITDKNGTQNISLHNGANGTNGTNGTNGVDGFSPSATVTENENGAVISITDKNGTTSAQVYNGEDGTGGGLEAHYNARTPYLNSGEQFDNVVQKGINLFQNSKVIINGAGYPLTFDMLFGIKSYAEANEDDILAVFIGEYGIGNSKAQRYPTFHYIKKAVSGSYYELDLRQIYLPDTFIHTGLDTTITGSWTFNNLPESSVTPTTNNQLVNKKYVDDMIASITDGDGVSY